MATPEFERAYREVFSMYLHNECILRKVTIPVGSSDFEERFTYFRTTRDFRRLLSWSLAEINQLLDRRAEIYALQKKCLEAAQVHETPLYWMRHSSKAAPEGRSEKGDQVVSWLTDNNSNSVWCTTTATFKGGQSATFQAAVISASTTPKGVALQQFLSDGVTKGKAFTEGLLRCLRQFLHIVSVVRKLKSNKVVRLCGFCADVFTPSILSDWVDGANLYHWLYEYQKQTTKHFISFLDKNPDLYLIQDPHSTPDAEKKSFLHGIVQNLIVTKQLTTTDSVFNMIDNVPQRRVPGWSSAAIITNQTTNNPTTNTNSTTHINNINNNFNHTTGTGSSSYANSSGADRRINPYGGAGAGPTGANPYGPRATLPSNANANNNMLSNNNNNSNVNKQPNFFAKLFACCGQSYKKNDNHGNNTNNITINENNTNSNRVVIQSHFPNSALKTTNNSNNNQLQSTYPATTKPSVAMTGSTTDLLSNNNTNNNVSNNVNSSAPVLSPNPRGESTVRFTRASMAGNVRINSHARGKSLGSDLIGASPMARVSQASHVAWDGTLFSDFPKLFHYTNEHKRVNRPDDPVVDVNWTDVSLRLQVCLKLAQGVADMHAANVGHFDLALKNVMYDVASGNVTIIDLGSVCELDEDGCVKELHENFAYSRPYLHPSRRKGLKWNARDDAHALLMTIAEVLGAPPADVWKRLSDKWQFPFPRDVEDLGLARWMRGALLCRLDDEQKPSVGEIVDCMQKALLALKKWTLGDTLPSVDFGNTEPLLPVACNGLTGPHAMQMAQMQSGGQTNSNSLNNANPHRRATTNTLLPINRNSQFQPQSRNANSNYNLLANSGSLQTIPLNNNENNQTQPATNFIVQQHTHIARTSARHNSRNHSMELPPLGGQKSKKPLTVSQESDDPRGPKVNALLKGITLDDNTTMSANEGAL